MCKKLKLVYKQEKDAVQRAYDTEMETMTMGDTSLKKAWRLHNKQLAQGLH